jgi:hypothetical protein
VQHPTIETGRYTLIAQALHWLTVLLILMILPGAWVMMSLPEGTEQSRMLVLHLCRCPRPQEGSAAALCLHGA